MLLRILTIISFLLLSSCSKQDGGTWEHLEGFDFGEGLSDTLQVGDQLKSHGQTGTIVEIKNDKMTIKSGPRTTVYKYQSNELKLVGAYIATGILILLVVSSKLLWRSERFSNSLYKLSSLLIGALCLAYLFFTYYMKYEM